MKQKVNVKGHIRDLLAFKKLVPTRKKRIKKASSEPIKTGALNNLAKRLHPQKQYLVIDKITEETPTTKTFTFVPAPNTETTELAFFRAGQYLSLRTEVNKAYISRPYSISSSPFDALNGIYEITIKKVEGGFLTDHIWKNWKVGDKIESTAPEGNFYYERLRDKKNVVGIAGGSGITPFRAIARMIDAGKLDINMVLLYGSYDEKEIIFLEEFKKLQEKNPEKIKLVNILSGENASLEGSEKGFITAEIIKKYADVENSSFFICGPQAMYSFVKEQLDKLKIPRKRIRRELFGEIRDITKNKDFPQDKADLTFKIKVKIGAETHEIPAIATETVTVALERAKIKSATKCRSGECGYCRSFLKSGKVYVNPENDGRRAADKHKNYFHPCSSYPIDNLEIIVPKEV